MQSYYFDRLSVGAGPAAATAPVSDGMRSLRTFRVAPIPGLPQAQAIQFATVAFERPTIAIARRLESGAALFSDENAGADILLSIGGAQPINLANLASPDEAFESAGASVFVPYEPLYATLVPALPTPVPLVLGFDSARTFSVAPDARVDILLEFIALSE